LNLEARFPEPVRAALGAMGHNVQILGEWEATGHEQIIQIDQESGAMIAGRLRACVVVEASIA
jgi:hypothetical protein